MRKSTPLVFAFVLFGVSIFVAPNCLAQLTAEVRENTVVVFAPEPVEAAGLELLSTAGRLVPIPDPPGPSPFTFFLANTPNQITWGNLGSTTTLDGAFNTRAGYTGDPAGDLTAAWGNGPMPASISVSLSGEPIPEGAGTPAQPPTVNPPVDPPIVNPPSDKDGLLTGEIREGKFVVVSTQPVAVSGLDLKSQAGRLSPVPDPPGSTPFQFLLSNSPNQITWGNLGTTVTIDGTLATEAGYSGDPAGDLTGAWGDGPLPVNLPINVSGEVIPIPDPPTLDPPTNPDPPVVPVDPPTPDPPVTPPVQPVDPAPGTISGTINDDGFVVLSVSEAVAIVGIDLQSPAGNLVPVSEDVGPAPFAFFLSNTPNQITWGVLGTGVSLDGDFVTGAQYNGDPAGDLLAFWGNGPTSVAFAIGNADGVGPTVPGNEVIPEPTGLSLAALAFVGLLGLRRRRK